MAEAPDGARRRFPLAARIVVAMLLGGGVGAWSGPLAARLGPVGTVIIDLIKGLAAPLLFFAVLDAFLRTRVTARAGLIMVAISLANATVAVGIGLTLSNTLRPGEHLRLPPGATSTGAAAEFQAKAQELDVVRELVGYLPTNVVRPFVDNVIITIIIVTVLAGAALRRVKNEQMARGEDAYRAVEDFVATAYRAVEVALGWLIQLVPLAVFAAVARSVGQYGLGPLLRGLSVYVGVAVLGLLLQVGLVYQGWLVLASRFPLRRFWAGAREPVVYAMGSSSSLATLPVTLRSLDRMGVSPGSARLAACVGTNLNNDGILLYEAMAALFVAQVHGIPLDVGQQLLVALCCVLAGIGIGGVPDGGLISLAVVLATVHLPVEILPLLLTVDWALSRCRAMTNVVSDLLVAVLLDRFAGRSEAEGTDRPVTSDPDGI